jgi:hypothetical protein
MLLRNAEITGGRLGDAYRDIHTLTDWAGKPATVAALSFVAYLLGTVSVTATEWINATRSTAKLLIRRLGSHTRRQLEYRIAQTIREQVVDLYLSNADFQQRVAAIVDRARREFAVDGELVAREFTLALEPGTDTVEFENDIDRDRFLAAVVDHSALRRQFRDDIDSLRYRLLGVEQDVYEVSARLRSEGEFRSAIVLPSMLLGCATALTVSPWFWLSLIVPVFFASLGADALAKAEEDLISVVESGRIDLPALTRLSAAEVPLRPYDDVFYLPDN